MIEPPLKLTMHSADDTAGLAQSIGHHLHNGDCLLLAGPIGAGKTHFARQLIQSLMTNPEDVPSPSFTLVQTYETRAGDIWHADLYRLTAAEEIEELGLTDAFSSAICLIEWPEILGSQTPGNALTIRFCSDTVAPDTRHITFEWTDPKWSRILEQIAND